MSGTTIRYTVVCEWDADANVWVATSPDIIGLVLEYPTLAGVLNEAGLAAPVLLKSNNQDFPA